MGYYFFFFKQKTAYEMRIRDWSSDVCSSDLQCDARSRQRDEDQSQPQGADARWLLRSGDAVLCRQIRIAAPADRRGTTGQHRDAFLSFRAHDLCPSGVAQDLALGRSEERRVGKECVSTCRSRWSP